MDSETELQEENSANVSPHENRILSEKMPIEINQPLWKVLTILTTSVVNRWEEIPTDERRKTIKTLIIVMTRPVKTLFNFNEYPFRKLKYMFFMYNFVYTSTI